MNVYFKRIVVACVITWIYCPVLHSQQRDVLFIQRGENEKIKFAQFAVDEKLDKIAKSTN